MADTHPHTPPQLLQDENQRLKRAVEELSILNDLARAIGASLNSDEIMRTIIHRSLRAIGAEQGVITLVDLTANASMKTLVRTAVSSGEREAYHFNQSLLGWMHLNKKPLLINDPRRDERFKGVTWDNSVKSLLSVPMVVKSQLRGVLTAYNKKSGTVFTEEDQRLLAIIAAQSAQVIENARLYEAEQTLFQVKEELRLAAKIQNDLLPASAPTVAGYDLAGRSIPAQIVGGDYFDFIRISDERMGICLGDVSGKGLPASLLMANVQATLRSQAITDAGPSLCIKRSNRLLFQSTSSDKFVTLFYGVLDRGAHTLSYCNAGHEVPLLLRAQGEHQRLSIGGVVLSIVEDFPFEEERITLLPGDVLVIFSDGITEAEDTAHRLFTEDRIPAIIERHRLAPAAEIIDHLTEAVRAYAAGTPQFDDMTIVVIKRLMDFSSFSSA